MRDVSLNKIYNGQEIDIIRNNSLKTAKITSITPRGIIVEWEVPNYEDLIDAINDNIEYCVCISEDIIRCRSTIVGEKHESSTQLIMLTKPEIVATSDRRKYVRVETDMHFDYVLLNAGEKIYYRTMPDELLGRKESAVLKNISGGGMCFISEKPLEIGKRLYIMLKLKETLTIEGEVVRIDENIEGKHYEIAIKYDKINDKSRQEINRYVLSTLLYKNKL